MSVDPALIPPGEPGVRDWGVHAQQRAEKHLDAVQQAQDCLEGQCETHDEDSEESCPDPSFGPYCGCTTCMVREVLAAAWPVIVAAQRSGDFDDTP